MSKFVFCIAIIAPFLELVNSFLKKIGKIFRLLEKYFQKPLYKSDLLCYNDSIKENTCGFIPKLEDWLSEMEFELSAKKKGVIRWNIPTLTG